MNLKYYVERKDISVKQKKPNWRIKKLLDNISPGMKVLDIGCANGSLSEHIIKKKAEYYGLDYNDYFLNICRKKKLIVKKCDVSKEKIPYNNKMFDAIYCAHILEHMGTYEQIHFIKECARILKKGGKIHIFSPTPYNPYFWEDETHVRPCTHGQLVNLVKNFDFKIIESKYSLVRMFNNNSQRYLRLPPLRFFLWEVYLIAEK
jgi:ubiquinone/menaquinone biosynthesis C-methylase UbiE